jgi:hypothetical protein
MHGSTRLVNVSSALSLLLLHQQDKARGEVKELADMPSQVGLDVQLQMTGLITWLAAC